MHLQKEQTWQERQAQVEAKLRQLEELAASFMAPHVVSNPYGVAPLTAMVLFTTEDPTAVQVTIYAPDGTADLQYSTEIAINHRVAIYGLYADCTNKVLLQLENGEQCELLINTQALPEQLAKGSAEGTLPVGQWIFTVPLADTSLPAAYDKDGICRWYSTEAMAYQMMPDTNGHLLACGPALLSPPYSATAIRELDILGYIHKEYRVPGGVCHAFCVLENGNFLAIHQFFNRGTAADMCIEIDRQTGAVVKEWDFRTLLPMSKGGSTSQSGSDWFHANGICYQKEQDAILVSGKYQDCIISVGYTSGKLNWILGDPTGWPEDLVEQYFLAPQSDGFEWCYEPGNIQVLGDQQILCFDNGHLRTKKGGTPLAAEERYSRAVCYQIDAEAKTVSQVWAYGKEAGTQLYSPYLSSCVWKDSDACLVNFGGIGIRNGFVAEPPAYFLQKDHPEVEMRTVIQLLNGVSAQGSASYQLTLPINCYYADQINAAQLRTVSTEGNSSVLGNWHGNDLYDLEMEWEDAGLIDGSYEICATLTGEQLILSGTFIQGEMVMLMLESSREKRLYYMQTTRSPYLTVSAQTYAKGSQRPIRYIVDVTSLSGEYEICIGLDDKKYHTDLWFVCE